MSVEDEFRAARLRILQNKTKIIPKDKKIDLDAVAVEAGRPKGSIRKSRYPDLYELIMNDIKNISETPLEECNRIKKKYKEEIEYLQQKLADLYGQTIMLMKRLEELEK